MVLLQLVKLQESNSYVNDPQTETDGLDIYVRWEDDYANGVLSAGMEAAYVIDYSVAATLKVVLK